MCGLFGIVSQSYLTPQDKDKFISLSFLSSIRGIDSTGYAKLYNNFTTKKVESNIIKSALDPISFSKTREAKKFIDGSAKALLGHTRSATRGSINTENAHPFVSKDGRFIMFHNGTLQEDSKDFGTDSEWLCNRIAEKEGNLEEGLHEVRGAYTIVLYDRELKKLSIVRNNERPLFYKILGDTMVFASTKSMLDAIGVADSISLDVHKVKTFTIEDLEKGGRGEFAEHTITPRRFSYVYQPRYQGYGQGCYGYGAYDSSWDDERWDNIVPFGTKPVDKQDDQKGSNAGVKPVEGQGGTKSIHSPSSSKSLIVKKDSEETPEVNSLRRDTLCVVDFFGKAYTKDSLISLGMTKDDAGVLLDISEEFTIFGAEKVEGSDDEYKPIIEVYTDDDRRPVSFQHWKDILNEGCCICSNPGHPSEKRHWHNNSTFFCEICTEVYGNDIKQVTIN